MRVRVIKFYPGKQISEPEKPTISSLSGLRQSQLRRKKPLTNETADDIIIKRFTRAAHRTLKIE